MVLPHCNDCDNAWQGVADSDVTIRNAAITAASDKRPLCVLLPWCEVTSLLKQQFDVKDHFNWKNPRERSRGEELAGEQSYEQLKHQPWVSVCQKSNTPVVLLLNCYGQYVSPARQHQVQRLCLQWLQLLPAGSLVEPISAAKLIDKEWLRGQPQGVPAAELGVRKVLQNNLADLFTRLTSCTIQAWTLTAQSRGPWSQFNRRYFMLAAALEKQQQPEPQENSKPADRLVTYKQHTDCTTGCLALQELSSSEVAREAIAVARQILSTNKAADITKLQEDLIMVEAAVSKLLQHEFQDAREEWLYGVSASALAAVEFSIKWLDRLPDDTLAQVTHDLESAASDNMWLTQLPVGKHGRLSIPRAEGTEAARSAQFELVLLFLSVRWRSVLEVEPGAERPLFAERSISQSIFWLLFCLHGLVAAGPWRTLQKTPTDLTQSQGGTWAQQTIAREVLQHLLVHIDDGWKTSQESWQCTTARQQHSTWNTDNPQSELPAAHQNPVHHQRSLTAAREHLGLVLGGFANVCDWMRESVLPGLQHHEHLGPLLGLLRKLMNTIWGGQRPKGYGCEQGYGCDQQAGVNGAKQHSGRRRGKVAAAAKVTACTKLSNRCGVRQDWELPGNLAEYTATSTPATAAAAAAAHTCTVLHLDDSDAASHYDGRPVRVSRRGAALGTHQSQSKTITSQLPEKGFDINKLTRELCKGHTQVSKVRLSPLLSPARQQLMMVGNGNTCDSAHLLDDADSKQRVLGKGTRGKTTSGSLDWHKKDPPHSASMLPQHSSEAAGTCCKAAPAAPTDEANSALAELQVPVQEVAVTAAEAALPVTALPAAPPPEAEAAATAALPSPLAASATAVPLPQPPTIVSAERRAAPPAPAAAQAPAPHAATAADPLPPAAVTGGMLQAALSFSFKPAPAAAIDPKKSVHGRGQQQGVQPPPAGHHHSTSNHWRQSQPATFEAADSKRSHHLPPPRPVHQQQHAPTWGVGSSRAALTGHTAARRGRPKFRFQSAAVPAVTAARPTAWLQLPPAPTVPLDLPIGPSTAARGAAAVASQADCKASQQRDSQQVLTGGSITPHPSGVIPCRLWGGTADGPANSPQPKQQQQPIVESYHDVDVIPGTPLSEMEEEKEPSPDLKSMTGAPRNSQGRVPGAVLMREAYLRSLAAAEAAAAAAAQAEATAAAEAAVKAAAVREAAVATKAADIDRPSHVPAIPAALRAAGYGKDAHVELGVACEQQARVLAAGSRSKLQAAIHTHTQEPTTRVPGNATAAITSDMAATGGFAQQTVVLRQGLPSQLQMTAGGTIPSRCHHASPCEAAAHLDLNNDAQTRSTALQQTKQHREMHRCNREPPANSATYPPFASVPLVDLAVVNALLQGLFTAGADDDSAGHSRRRRYKRQKTSHK